jgi:S-adenosyl-L-methionine hydrolase (adenosine-forming)
MVITFLSDYGLEDDFVGVCHAVIAGIARDLRVIDLTHGVPRHDVRSGALILRGALPYLPIGVHLAVVDPDVGARRRAVALRTADGRLLVGPDNGLLSLAAARAGGVIEAIDISRSQFRLQPVSATFHGRDIFAPIAARLAAGAALSDAGERCDPGRLVTIELPPPRRDDGGIVAQAIYVDRFGNVQLSAAHDQLAGFGLKLGHRVELQIGDRGPYPAHYVRTFADVDPDQLLIYEDGDRLLAVAISHGDAATRLGVKAGDDLRITLA